MVVVDGERESFVRVVAGRLRYGLSRTSGTREQTPCGCPGPSRNNDHNDHNLKTVQRISLLIFIQQFYLQLAHMSKNVCPFAKSHLWGWNKRNQGDRAL